MRNPHVWNLLALHVPNLLPRSVFKSQFPRHAGRLIWATIIFTIGLLIGFMALRRPKKSDEPATWAASFLGALYVWAMFALGYGVIPHEWLNFGAAYLNFDSSSFLLHKNSVLPFDITRDKFVDSGAVVIYAIVLTLNVLFFVAWQKRKVVEPESEAEQVAPTTGGGVFSRLRREKRTSAYGRPVTTSE